MRILVLLACALSFGLAGCAARTVDDLPDELRQSAVISMSGPGRLPPGGSYQIHPGSRVMVDDPRFDQEEVERMVRDLLVEGLAERGWRPALGGASVTLGYLVALDDPLSDDTVREMLGVDPGLAPTAGHHERGTLVVQLHRSGTNLTLWRGAVQILAEPDLPQDVRTERARRAIAALLARMQ